MHASKPVCNLKKSKSFVYKQNNKNQTLHNRMPACLTVVDDHITAEFVSKQWAFKVLNHECPVCLESMSGKGLCIYSCTVHATCAECGSHPTCPLCRSPESPLELLVISLEKTQESVNNNEITLDACYLRKMLAKVIQPSNRKQVVALKCIRKIINNESLIWHDLWHIKKFTSVLNSYRPPDGYTEFLQAVTEHRVQIIDDILPKVQAYADVLLPSLP